MSDPAKSGWLTSEFWLNLAAVVAAYLITTGGDFADESTVIGKAAAAIVVILGALGYTGSRAVVKREKIRK